MHPAADRDRLVHFAIPSNWAVEYEDDGTGIYFDPTRGSATLRLTVLTALGVPSGEDIAAWAFAKLPARPGATASRLRDGRMIRRYREDALEGSDSVATQQWDVVGAIADDAVRIAMFSLTALVHEFDSPEGERLRVEIDTAIANSVFAPAV